MKEIKQLIEIPNIHPALKVQLEQNMRIPSLDDCVLTSPEIAVIVSSRRDCSAGGGVARYSILRVMYKDEVKMREWQYSDKYSHSADRWDLMILRTGKVEITEAGETISVTVECIAPEGYSPRTVRFEFKRKDDAALMKLNELPADVQVIFDGWVQDERTRIEREIMGTWSRNTHTMPTPHGRVPYNQPRIKEVRINRPIGLAVIVAEEQIDFDTLGNPQMQQKAYLLNWNGKTVAMVREEHAYVGGGSATIDVINISQKEVVLGTQSGHVTIAV
jgi:hypothetical protein